MIRRLLCYMGLHFWNSIETQHYLDLKTNIVHCPYCNTVLCGDEANVVDYDDVEKRYSK